MGNEVRKEKDSGPLSRPYWKEKATHATGRWFEVSVLLFGLLVGSEYKGFVESSRTEALSLRMDKLDTDLTQHMADIFRDLQAGFVSSDDKANLKIDKLADELREAVERGMGQRAEILQRVAKIEGVHGRD